MADNETVWNTPWASGDSADIEAPSIERIKSGWEDNEYPSNEWFNWLQNRTDVRLGDLENPIETLEVSSKAGTRQSTISKNSEYTVPAYTVGKGHLQVYLDGILCNIGETYAEVGVTGATSTKIKWLEAIDNTYDILCRAPNQASENNYLHDQVSAYVVNALDENLQDQITAYVEAALAAAEDSGQEDNGGE